MNYKTDLECSESVERCEDCPAPEGCIWECVIEKYTHEDVAKIRGEEITNAVR